MKSPVVVLIAALCVGSLSIGWAAEPPPLPQIKGEPLGVWLPVAGKKVGVPLASGPNARDRRLFLFPTGCKFEEVRAKLQDFVPFSPGTARWYADGSVLTFDEDLVSKQTRLREAEEEVVQRAARHRTARYTEVRNWARRDGPGEPPVMRQLRQRISAFLDVLDGFPPALRAAAFQGHRVEVPYALLTAAGQNAVRGLLGRATLTVDGNPQPLFDGKTDIPKVIVRALPAGTPDAPGLEVHLQMHRVASKTMLDLLHPRMPGGVGGEDARGLMKEYAARERGPADRKELAALRNPITLTGGADSTVEAVLAEFSSRSGLPIIGEYDPCFLHPADRTRTRQKFLLPKEVEDRPLWSALDVVAARFDLDWDFKNGWIEIRSPRTLRSFAGVLDLSPPRNPKKHSDVPDS